ncbi:MAG TPA: glycerol-3-phosphate dehydrogenase/oxidase [Tenuifilaceae bacterium]|nr:glycerol-3-phosphate dehydrogenase/oxidase [Tenuifilaceae bacterium]
MERIFDKPSQSNFDIIVIGGGITGVSVAYEAATRGLSVALFEKDDFGQATSAATSKLIHGGLRYLKNLEFGLVRESLTERRVWENIAPNFVYPIPFMVPTYNNLKSNRFFLFMGMVLYDILSYDKAWTWDKTKKLPLHSTISAKRTLSLEKCVKTKGLTGSSIYYDCQNINPERLTLSVLKSAIANGVKAANYAKVKSFVRSNGNILGVNVVDSLSGIEHQFTAKVTINCAGPWADIVLNSANTENGKKHNIRRSEGIHIITKKLVNKHAVTVMTKDGRHIMLMPWRNHSLIGTTDKEYTGDPDDYKVTKESIQGLIDDMNENYGCEQLKYEDVIFAYGGLRPLVDDQTQGSYESSRKYEIYDNAKNGLNGLITIEGGKYTTSRKLACQAMRKVEKKLNRKLEKSVTNKQYLEGSNIKDMSDFITKLKSNYPNFSPETVEYVGKNYGTHCHEVFTIAKSSSNLNEVITNDGEILAEVAYAIQHEMAKSLTDIFFRRTGIGTLGYPGDEVFNKVTNIAQEMLNWDENKTQLEVKKAMMIFNLPR